MASTVRRPHGSAGNRQIGLGIAPVPIIAIGVRTDRARPTPNDDDLCIDLHHSKLPRLPSGPTRSLGPRSGKPPPRMVLPRPSHYRPRRVAGGNGDRPDEFPSTGRPVAKHGSSLVRQHVLTTSQGDGAVGKDHRVGRLPSGIPALLFLASLGEFPNSPAPEGRRGDP